MREASDFHFGGGREGAVCYGQGVSDLACRSALLSCGNRGRRVFLSAFPAWGRLPRTDRWIFWEALGCDKSELLEFASVSCTGRCVAMFESGKMRTSVAALAMSSLAMKKSMNDTPFACVRFPLG